MKGMTKESRRFVVGKHQKRAPATIDEVITASIVEVNSWTTEVSFFSASFAKPIVPVSYPKTSPPSKLVAAGIATDIIFTIKMKCQGSINISFLQSAFDML